MAATPRHFSRRFPEYGWAWPRGDHDRLLRAALFPDETAALACAEAWLGTHDIDTADFRDHRLLAAISQRFGKRLAGHAAYPRLVGLRRHLWTRSRMAAREAEPALAAIAAAGVKIMLIKGASRTAIDPAAGTGRVAHDIDIVVRRDDMLATFRILTKAGWTPSTGASPAYVETQLASLRALNFFIGDFGAIDLHQEAYPEHPDGADESRVWREADAAVFHGVAVVVPSAADRAAMAIAYGALDAHIHSDWLVDCAVAIRSAGFSWTAFANVVACRGLAPASAIVLSYLSQELRVPIPAAILDDIVAAADGGGLTRLGALLQAKPRTDMGRLLHAARWLAKRRRLRRASAARASNPQPVCRGRRVRGVALPVSESRPAFATTHPLDLPAASGGTPAILTLLVRIAVPSVARRIEMEINGPSTHIARLRCRKRGPAPGMLDLRYEIPIPLGLAGSSLTIEARPNRQLRRTAPPDEIARYGALPFQVIRFDTRPG